MLDFTWKIFSQTGNIEAYLLLKELERYQQENDNDHHFENKTVYHDA